MYNRDHSARRAVGFLPVSLLDRFFTDGPFKKLIYGEDMPKPWAQQAADNAILILPFLVDAEEDTPIINAADIARRIEKSFPDRTSWNAAIHESELDWFLKVWLLVP